MAKPAHLRTFSDNEALYEQNDVKARTVRFNDKTDYACQKSTFDRALFLTKWNETVNRSKWSLLIKLGGFSSIEQYH